jgi:hypothetical protein
MHSQHGWKVVCYAMKMNLEISGEGLRLATDL